jgi:hypothetical protein
MPNFGILPTGFVPMRQADCLASLQSDLTNTFGQTTDLSADTLLGQLAAIFSEREALIWAALQDVSNSLSPQSAEGVFVDNILALNNLTREQARPTVTNPTPDILPNGLVLAGLVLTGVEGTTIDAGSVVQTATLPTRNFKLDRAVTIGKAVNAVQELVFSSAPSSGFYRLSLLAPSGDTLTTPSIEYDALPQNTLLAFDKRATRGSFVLSIGDTATAPLPYNVTPANLQSAIRALPAMANTTVTQTMSGYVVAWPSGASAPYAGVDSALLTFSAAPTTGSFSLSLQGQVTTALSNTALASDIQAALRALPGFENLGVSGTQQAGFYIHFKDSPTQSVSVVSNTTDASISVAPSNTVDFSATPVNSIQASINVLRDTATTLAPFTDVSVQQQTNQTFSVNFGANAVDSGQPKSSARAQARLVVPSQSLLSGNALVNLSTNISSLGQPAQATGSATATQTGPFVVPANTLTVIGSGVSGWTGVTNPLDCVTGADVESASAALSRRLGLLASRGNGALPALIDKVLAVSGVNACIGFENLTLAASQSIQLSAPAKGSFCLSVGGRVTEPIAASAGAADIQNALAALSGLELALVSGSQAYGFLVDFNGSEGGQPQPLIGVLDNQSLVTITTSFARPAKSYELLVQGGADADIAQAILAAAPVGIASYGTPTLRTTGSCTAGSASVVLATTEGLFAGQALVGQGLAAGSVVVAIDGVNAILSIPAISSYSNVAMTASTTVTVLDSQNNPHAISFSRPQPVVLFIEVVLLTDYYYQPGVASSGINPNAAFSPASLLDIQNDLLALASAVPIGGLVVGHGYQGLVGSFNDVSGILGYTLTFGVEPGSGNTQNLRLQPEQIVSAQLENVDVSFT